MDEDMLSRLGVLIVLDAFQRTRYIFNVYLHACFSLVCIKNINELLPFISGYQEVRD